MIYPAAVKRNLVGGQWVATGAALENRSPSDLDDVVGIYAQGDAADVAAAVESAQSAAPKWLEMTSQQRADFLDRVGTVVLARCEDIGRLLSREEGKTLSEGIAEVNRAGRVFKFFAGEALRMTGDRIESVRPGVDIEVVRQPVGVVGIITPWNFPIAIPAWKVAAALAYGNTVVLKPAELTPGSAHVMAEILVECGCPAGAFNLVMGCGTIVGRALVEHPGADAISFTGSVPVGREVVTRCAAGHRKVQAEMGGKNPMVILDDADLAVALPACIDAAFASTGQRCTAASRFIVQKGIANAFKECLVATVRDLRVGHALDPTTQIGPVVSESQLISNLRYVALASQDGAKVIGGEPVERETRGYYQRPALFLNATNAMRSSQEEIFGPCASVIEARDFDHALELANDTTFGLSAGICTQSLKWSREFKRRAAAGVVTVNLPTAGVDYHVPFGGWKSSSYGPREQGRYAIEFYTSVKTSYTYVG